TDGGASWHEPEAPNPGIGDIFTTAANGGLSLSVSPDFANDGTVFEGDNRGAVSISHDRGLTWTVSLLGSPPQPGRDAYGLQLWTSFRSDRTVYLGLGNQGFGAAKSNDGGQSWFSAVPVDRSGEIADDFVRDLALSQEPSGVVDLAIGLGITGLINAKDTPAATTAPEWSGMNFANTDAVTVSPDYQRDCTMFVAGLGGTLDAGVYRSTN